MRTPTHKQALPTPGLQQRSPVRAIRSPRAPAATQAYERKNDSEVLQRRSFTVQIKAPNEAGVIEGYGSVFDTLDSYDDTIAAGAFATSLAAHKSMGTMPAMLWQHNNNEPIGVWTEMVEDSKGLRVKGQLCMDIQAGKDAHALLRMGALNGLSIGFVSKSWAYDESTDVRTLTEVDLWEVSLVTFPANGKSRITNVKSSGETLLTPKDAERVLRDAGMSKADATAFVSRVMSMGESRSDSARADAEVKTALQALLTTLQTH